MALRYSFEPGPQQSLAACHYFSMLGGDLVDAYASDPEPRQFLIGQMGFAPQPMRVWAAKDHGPEHMYALLPWVRSIKAAVRSITDQHSNAGVLDLMRTWMDAHHAEETLFIELPRPEHAFTEKESLALTIGIVAGETVLLSAPNIMFVKLDQDLFGLSVANTGSYLVERLHGRENEAVYLRKAS